MAGMGKFIFWDTHMELMAVHNMILIPFFLAIAGISQVIGSICILINKQKEMTKQIWRNVLIKKEREY